MSRLRSHNRKAILAEVATGLKTVKSIAIDHGCSEVYVYKVMSVFGYSKQFITQDEWRIVMKHRAKSKATSPDGVTPLVGSESYATGKARRASDSAQLVQAMD